MVTRTKTFPRTIRIAEDVDTGLKKSAKQERKNINDLTKEIMRKYVEWDYWIEKIDYIGLSQDGFRSILEATDDAKLTKAAQEGANQFRGAILLRSKKVDYGTLLEWLSLSGKYSGCFEYEHESDGRNFSITLHHKLGKKWSNYLRDLFLQFRDVFGKIPQIETTENTVTIKSTESRQTLI